MKLSEAKAGMKVIALRDVWPGDVPKGAIGTIERHDHMHLFVVFSESKKHPDGFYDDAEYYEPAVSVSNTVHASNTVLPHDAKERKKIPLAGGVLDYFTQALVEVAKVSYAGNEQHNPGQPLHWARGKSTDQADTMLRHFLERGTVDDDGMRHSAKMCWRALAILQLELEAEGAPIARGAK